MDRQPAVAGSFYPADEDELRRKVSSFIGEVQSPKKVICAISPHAGYIYSGGIAGKVFANIEVPKKCIILSPNHTGMGKPAAIMTSGDWIIPGQNIPIDKKLSSEILDGSNALSEDASTHIAEHSIEVQLPFLSSRRKEVSIVPITLSYLGMKACKDIKNAISNAIKKCDEDILIIASSDMNHYESQDVTVNKDKIAIERIIQMDARGLIETCSQNHITMCGVIPTAISVMIAKELGATKAELIAHGTSGDTNGDYSSVVGYAGIVIY